MKRLHEIPSTTKTNLYVDAEISNAFTKSRLDRSASVLAVNSAPKRALSDPLICNQRKATMMSMPKAIALNQVK